VIATEDEKIIELFQLPLSRSGKIPLKFPGSTSWSGSAPKSNDLLERNPTPSKNVIKNSSKSFWVIQLIRTNKGKSIVILGGGNNVTWQLKSWTKQIKSNQIKIWAQAMLWCRSNNTTQSYVQSVMDSSILVELLLPFPVRSHRSVIHHNPDFSNLSNRFLNVSIVSDEITDSGKLFHTFVTCTINEY